MTTPVRAVAFLAVFTLITLGSFSQTPAWTFLGGPTFTPLYGIYGTQGIAAASNKAPARYNQTKWTDPDGNIWVFGGQGYNNANSSSGYFNDLWKYNRSTKQWTWMSGSTASTPAAVYGTKGTAAAGNTPGYHYSAMGCTDGNGDLYLFGGQGSGSTNELWKYTRSTGLWTWLSGDNTSNVVGVYGTQGTAAASNKPGSRYGGGMWYDGAGNIWIFGGYGYGSTTSANYLNDLWKYSLSTGQWTWVSGDNITQQQGVYGTKGIASGTNKPGARGFFPYWSDAAGNLYMFGGNGYTTSASPGVMNDLWKYNPTAGTWTWINGDNTNLQPAVYGTTGVAATSNKPGARSYAGGAMDAAGNCWIFGGTGYNATNSGNLNELWKYDPVGDTWTFVAGDNSHNVAGVYGTRGAYDPSTRPGTRQSSILWFDEDGNPWIQGGYGNIVTPSLPSALNDTWTFSLSNNQWSWQAGDYENLQFGTYGTQGVASSNNWPGGRTMPASATDANGDLWLFGGQGYANSSSGLLNDLWKYSKASGQWAWITGDSIINQLGVYGTKGTAASTNKPGGRKGGTMWLDASGNLYLFGGTGIATSTSIQTQLNDLWKYTLATGQWTWLSGANANGALGTYGTKGTASTSNTPGARWNIAHWMDASGNLWLFGGTGYPASGSAGSLNDLWKYNPTAGTWTWVTGSNAVSAKSTYGVKGVSAAANTPGGRLYLTAAGTGTTFWLYGGYGVSGSTNGDLQDLWKFTPSNNQWTWVGGDTTQLNHAGVYGTKGTGSTTNTPGSRENAAAGINNDGNLLLQGGYGYDASTSAGGSMNDLWSYNPTSSQWTWINGTSSVLQYATYGAQGVADAVTTPGQRQFAASWIDQNGNFTLFGGTGYSGAGGSAIQGDMMSFSMTATLPVRLTSFTGGWLNAQSTRLSWSSAMEQNSKTYVIERSATGQQYVVIGSVPAAGHAASYTFTDLNPLTVNFYRLRMVDLDSSSAYSGVVLLSRSASGASGAACRLLGNPVRGTLTMQVTTAVAGPLLVQVVDRSGRVLYSGSRSGGTGVTVLSLDGSRWAPGYYAVKVAGGGIDTTVPFVVIR